MNKKDALAVAKAFDEGRENVFCPLTKIECQVNCEAYIKSKVAGDNSDPESNGWRLVMGCCTAWGVVPQVRFHPVGISA